MTKQHRLGFYHTFLANENIPADEWQGIHVADRVEPVFGLEVFVEYRLFNTETNDEILFDEDDYMPLHWYIHADITENGIVFTPNETLLSVSGYTLDYRVSEHCVIVNGEYTFSAGPHKGLTIQIPKPKAITETEFNAILFEHLERFINTENEPMQSTAYKRVKAKGEVV